jgi:hypothetical protein
MRADGPSDHRTQTQLVCKRTCEAVRSVDIRRSQFPMALDGGRKLLTTLWIPTVNINVFARYRCKLPADRERDHRVVDSRLGNLQLVRGCTEYDSSFLSRLLCSMSGAPSQFIC